MLQSLLVDFNAKYLLYFYSRPFTFPYFLNLSSVCQIYHLMKSITTWILFFYIMTPALKGQVGIQLNSPEATSGYALISLTNRAVLIDNCGEIVHQWNDTGNAQFHFKLLPNGNLVYISQGQIVERDWNGELIHSHGLFGVEFTYEVEVLPNGNYLAVGRRSITRQQAIQMGFDLSVQNPNQVDVVIEIDRESGDNIWEWNITDHMIQERDETVDNYGSVIENPQLLNIDALGTFDWTVNESFMINSMDYNPQLDQIVLSIRKMSEFVIIDHSTPAELVSGSTGGNQDKGGDIIYRYGNPQNYGQGSDDERQLYFQHNPNWVDAGPHAGKISVFNNGLSRPIDLASGRYSSADVIDTRINSDGGYQLNEMNTYDPMEADLRYSSTTLLDFNFYSGYLSGAKVLENGNVWITVGGSCLIKEVSPDGDLVWDYGYVTNTFCFRTVKYPYDYPAFDGKSLIPKGTVEFPPSNYDCNLISKTNNLNLLDQIDFLHNVDKNEIEISNNLYNLKGILYDLSGRIIQKDNITVENSNIKLKSMLPGFYFYTIKSNGIRASKTYKLIII